MFEEEKHDDFYTEERCDTKAKQEATICVPVTITPFAKVGTIVQNVAEDRSYLINMAIAKE